MQWHVGPHDIRLVTVLLDFVRCFEARHMSKPRLLVTGATGMVGYHVVRRALEHGYDVRAMVRSAKEPGPLPDAGDT